MLSIHSVYPRYAPGFCLTWLRYADSRPSTEHGKKCLARRPALTSQRNFFHSSSLLCIRSSQLLSSFETWLAKTALSGRHWKHAPSPKLRRVEEAAMRRPSSGGHRAGRQQRSTPWRSSSLHILSGYTCRPLEPWPRALRQRRLAPDAGCELHAQNECTVRNWLRRHTHAS